MPSGAKKRKALKKKKEQESMRMSKGNNNGDNLHVKISRNDEQEKESDGNLSSSGSQGNEEAGKRHLSSSGKDTVNEKVEASVIDSIQQIETTLKNSDSIKHNQYGEVEEKLLLGVEENKDSNVLTTSNRAETSKEIKTVVESEIPECCEEKPFLASGPTVERSSWFSCCGLLQLIAGSNR